MAATRWALGTQEGPGMRELWLGKECHLSKALGTAALSIPPQPHAPASLNTSNARLMIPARDKNRYTLNPASLTKHLKKEPGRMPRGIPPRLNVFKD